MTNIIRLDGNPDVRVAPHPDLVEKLEDLLERARAGQIRGVVFGVASADGTIGTGWSHDGSCHLALTAAAGALFHRAMEEL